LGCRPDPAGRRVSLRVTLDGGRVTTSLSGGVALQIVLVRNLTVGCRRSKIHGDAARSDDRVA
jgi:hypothetical protein